MTPTQTDLARRLVAYPRWQWAAGMLCRATVPPAIDGRITTMFPAFALSFLNGESVEYSTRWMATGGYIPDLLDPATVGCIAFRARYLIGPGWCALPPGALASAWTIARSHTSPLAMMPGTAAQTEGEAWALAILSVP